MHENGMWDLFFATGLPQAWMMARQAEKGKNLLNSSVSPERAYTADEGPSSKGQMT